MAIFWKEGCDFSIDTYSSNHIDAIVNKGKEDEWRFTGFMMSQTQTIALNLWQD